MKKFKNTAKTEALPAPRIQNIHRHEPNQAAGVALVALLAAVVALPVGWYVLVFLFDKAGFAHSEQSAAEFLIYGVGGVGLLAAIVAYLSFMWGDALERRYDHIERIEAEKTARERTRQLMANSVTDGSRQTKPGMSDFVNLVYLVALYSIDYASNFENGLITGTERPWSRRQVQKLVMSNGKKPTGSQAVAAKGFLTKNNVIIGPPTNEQWNWEKFADLAAVQRLVYLPPVVYGAQTEQRALSAGSYQHIDGV